MIIRGVGDEVLLGIIGSFLSILISYLGVMLLLKRPGRHSGEVHPDSINQIDTVRRERRVMNGSRTTEDAEDSTVTAGQDSTCPVCLDPQMQHAVETNCGHRFCAECVLQYWRQDQWPQPARCPICRRPVSELSQALVCRETCE